MPKKFRKTVSIELLNELNNFRTVLQRQSQSRKGLLKELMKGFSEELAKEFSESKEKKSKKNC